jgi:NosR/NirI family nitrous oxide reductase transcriptional regulator
MTPDIHDYTPPYVKTTGIKWLLNEVTDHLWPWNKQYWRHHKAIEAAGLALAVAVTTAWGLAANGQIGASTVIGWWIGWSIYEVIIRLQCKPYIKDGPWWGHRYRTAGRMDMICYVMFKNLLIGAILFIMLRNLGLLQMVD